MKRITKETLERQNEELRRENTLLSLAFQDSMLGGVFRLVHAHAEKAPLLGRYRWYVSRLDSPAGGLIVESFSQRGQRTHSAVYHLDEYGATAGSTEYGRARNQATEKAKRMRSLLLEKKKAGAS